MQTQSNDLNTLTNGAKILGESVIPGDSLLMDGQFINGAAHAAVGIFARIAMGPLAVALVCADSFSKSVTDKFLWDHVKDGIEARKQAKAAKAAEQTEAQAG